MDLSDIDRDIGQWKKLLEDNNLRATPYESQLVRFLLVHICGRYEKVVDELIAERAQRSGDKSLASYVKKAYKMRREPRSRHLQNDILQSFGAGHRKWFIANVTAIAKNGYDSLIDNRNLSAHGESIDVSLDEIILWHGHAKQVLGAFEAALGRPDDIVADSTGH